MKPTPPADAETPREVFASKSQEKRVRMQRAAKQAETPKDGEPEWTILHHGEVVDKLTGKRLSYVDEVSNVMPSGEPPASRSDNARLRHGIGAAFDCWRKGLPDGAFSHEEGIAFLRLVDLAFDVDERLQADAGGDPPAGWRDISADLVEEIDDWLGEDSWSGFLRAKGESPLRDLLRRCRSSLTGEQETG